MQGAFYNDCHILNTSSFCWHSLPGSSVSPAGRHHHACGFVGGRVVVHGGSHGSHVYDSLFSISFSFGRDFNRYALMTPPHLRVSLRQMTPGGRLSPQPCCAAPQRLQLWAVAHGGVRSVLLV